MKDFHPLWIIPNSLGNQSFMPLTFMLFGFRNKLDLSYPDHCCFCWVQYFQHSYKVCILWFSPITSITALWLFVGSYSLQRVVCFQNQWDMNNVHILKTIPFHYLIMAHCVFRSICVSEVLAVFMTWSSNLWALKGTLIIVILIINIVLWGLFSPALIEGR